MANFANPTVGSNYTDFPGEIRASVDAALQQLSVGSHTNIPTGAIKFDTSANRWKKFNGSAFVDLTSTYDLNANVTVNRLNLGDDEKISLGNSQDLLIFHSGSNSHIRDSGTGGVLLQGSQVNIQNVDGSENMAQFIVDGAASLFHNNTKRLETDGNGIQVTNRVGIGRSAGLSLDVEGSAQIGAASTADAELRIGRSGSGNRIARIDLIGDNTYSSSGLRIARTDTGANTQSQIIHRGTGDLVFNNFEAANMTFKTSNSNKARLTATGRLGLSTTNPQVLLDAGGASSGGLGGLNNSVLYAGLTNNTNFGGIVLGAGNNGNVPFVAASKLSDSSNLPLDFITAGTSRMRILADGKIGIGTTSPQSELVVRGSNPQVTLEPTSNTQNCRLQFCTTDGTVKSSIQGGGFQDSALRVIQISTETLRFDSSGRLGIGTSSPAVKLDVVHSNVSVSPGSNDIAVFRKTGEGYLKVLSNNAGVGGIAFGDTDDNFIGAVRYDHSDNALEFFVNNSEKVRVDSSGSLGLGTTSAASRLHVHGNALVEDTIGNNLTVRSTVNNGNDPNILFQKARGGGAPSIVQSGDDIGRFSWNGYDGDNYEMGASILGEIQGTPANGDMPMRMVFSTRPSGGGDIIGRLVINADGHVDVIGNLDVGAGIDCTGNIGIGTTSPTAPLHIQKSGTSQNLLTLESDMGTVNNRTLIIGSPTSDSMSEPFRFTTGNSIQFRIDASDALTITDTAKIGIGTPSPTTQLQIDTPSLNTSSLNTTNCSQLGLRVFASGAANTTGDIQSGITLGEGRAGLYAYDNGGSAANGLGFWTGSNSGVSEKVRIQSDGKVGISTNSPQVLLDVGGSSSGGLAGLTNPILYAGFTNNTSFGGVVLGAGANGNTPFIAASKKSNGTGLPLTFNSFGAEVFRISQNALQVGQTTSTNPGQGNTVVGASIEKNGRISSSTSDTTTGLNLNANTTSNSKHYISFRNSGSPIGSVTQNGASNVSYNDFSDRRVKENIAPLVNALTTLLKLKPVNYNYKADKEKKKFDGFIAQDLLEDEVCDYAATYIEREDWYGIDYSKLVTVAIAAIQELAGKVSDLEAKLG